MPKRKRIDEYSGGTVRDSTDLEDILSQLESVRSLAVELDRSLQSQVAEDSCFVSWRSYADRLRLDVPDANKSRALSQQLCSTLTDFLKTLRPASSSKKKRTTLVDEVFVDVFVYLSRYYLVAVQRSGRRFRDIVTAHLSASCLRIISVEFVDMAHVKEVDEQWRRDQPKRGHVSEPFADTYAFNFSGSHAGIYRLHIDSHTEDDRTVLHTFIFESKNVEDLLDRFREKASGAVYVRFFGIFGMMEKLPTFLRHNNLFKNATIGGLWLQDAKGNNRPQLDPAQTSDFIRMFESVTRLDIGERGVSDHFLRQCRTVGVVELGLYDEDEALHTFTTDGIIDFCLGPTLPGREKERRRISELWLPALDFFAQMLQACADADAFEHPISVELSEDASRLLQRDELLEELCKQYKSNYVAGAKLEHDEGHRYNPRGEGGIYWYLEESRIGGFELQIVHDSYLL